MQEFGDKGFGFMVDQFFGYVDFLVFQECGVFLFFMCVFKLVNFESEGMFDYDIVVLNNIVWVVGGLGVFLLIDDVCDFKIFK